MIETIQEINSIIKDITTPSIHVNDILLKVKVLAFKIKSAKLKEWCDNELSGYTTKSNNEVPKYRVIPSHPHCEMIYPTFGGYHRRPDLPLPTEFLDKETRDMLLTTTIKYSVSEIEKMISGGDRYAMNLPYSAIPVFEPYIEVGWEIQRIWLTMSSNSLQGIISSIKTHLISFLLELAEEIGQDEKLNIMDNKKEIEKLFDKTMGGVTINNINTHTNGSNNNIASGTDISQADIQISVSNEVYKKLEELGVPEQHINELKNIAIETKGDKESFMKRSLKWLGTVSTAVITKGLADNIPAITDAVQSLLN